MICPIGKGGTGPSRRGLLVGAGGLLASAGVGSVGRAVSPDVIRAAASVQARNIALTSSRVFATRSNAAK